MKTIKYIITTVCLVAALGLKLFSAQANGYTIVLTITGNPGGKVALSLQTTDKIETIDSLPLFSNGSYYFTGQKYLVPGQYTFVQNGRRLFNFLVSFEQNMDLQFYAKIENGQTTELLAYGDAENKAYMELQRFIQDMNRKPNFTEADVKRMDRYTDSISQRYPNTLLSIVARNISTPPLPKYMALHDRRVLNTSILPIRFQSFFTNIVPPQAELIIPHIDSILYSCTDPMVKDWCGSFLLSYFISSNIMGMENVAVHIARKYLSGEIKHEDPDLIYELANYVAFNEHSLIGMAAPELLLPDVDGRKVSLRNLSAEFTILLFYDEDCIVCQEEIPEIEEVYQHFKSKNVRVYAVYTQNRYEAWRKYILTLNREWTHVWDPDFSSGFHKLYNVTGTPMIYLLNRNKVIIGRQLDTSLLEEILSYLLH